ncbi:MAG: hypothetical protein H6581_30365 [Bacteroidia bacterium]|nr:hypothetical protein [Bacteroidia bacterium]
MKIKILALLALLTFTGFQTRACDICSFYFGLNPNYNLNQIGLRYRYRSISGSHDHGGGIQHTSREVFQGIDLMGRYCPSPKVRLWGLLPLNRNQSNDSQSEPVVYQGLGDLILGGDFQLFQILATDSGKATHRLFWRGGSSLPTGSFRQLDQWGSLDHTLQPGTGAFGLFTGANYLVGIGKFGLNALVTGRYFTPNAHHFRFGERLNLDLTLRYVINSESGGQVFYPLVGLFSEWAAPDHLLGFEYPGSGGIYAAGKAGFELYLGKFSLTGTAQIPFAQKMTGEKEGSAFLGGCFFSF